jgi:DNA-binding PadR family transcriptional regulator
MRVILESDEAWSLMMLVVAQVLDQVELSEEGREAVRRWRSEHADGTEAMHELAEAMNEALGNYLDEQTRRLIRRKGRYVSSVDMR